MKKYIQAYVSELKNFMAGMDKKSFREIAEVLSELETKISYFQHERFIHLIVTVLFALLSVGSFFVMMTSDSNVIGFAILFVLFMVLLVPYIMHYFFLENSVQEMYKLRDDIKRMLSSKQKKDGPEKA